MKAGEITDLRQERIRTLHFTWVAFFLTFVTWFNLAPLATTMLKHLDWLDKDGLKILLICNVALTIPARVIIGALLDRFGPRLVFSGLLVTMSIPCFAFALGNDLITLVVSRLVLSTIGAGFVIGVRMVSEWFPPKDIGFAEGIYAGWGNFGSAAAAMILPTMAIDWFGGPDGWRYSIASTGVVCFFYGILYYLKVQDTPKGQLYLGSRKTEPIEVSTFFDMGLLIFWTFPLYAALGVLAWKLYNIEFLGTHFYYGTLIFLGLFYLRDVVRIVKHNYPLLKNNEIPEDDHYSFNSVAALNTTYFANFGAELAVISMLPAFFESTFTISASQAGLVASSFAFVNLAARPLGGYLSDMFSSRRRIILCFMLGISLGFFSMSQINSTWPLALAVAVTIMCSAFVQGAEGATFAIIPLIKKRMTGKIAGMVGAYGNVGAVVYLTVFTMVDNKTFFLILGTGSAISFFYCLVFLKEPEGAFEEEFTMSSRDQILLSARDREMLEDAYKTGQKSRDDT